ncbi:hypothetical protein [Sulfurirhabdus autotrophica]|uniref:Putative secreted protein n=1 Tax=Sulfurirhabdus autotrophica TaxID=1706046 RepID=A0A4R3YAN8_9PROT|nr:hypothetical protein [Sulfurirhabdus autotrophica]TCV89067.1 putative secreted protein [Sulfurirhabdus autotrophica]
MKSKLVCFLALFALSSSASAVTVNFFDSSQIATTVSTGTNSDTISSNGYLFTYTLDKFFTGYADGSGTPIGRTSSVLWPNGVQAQAVTVGPAQGPAQITIKRIDGNVFDITAFTAKLLANTAGAGGAIEVMPLLNGNDGLPNPAAFDATGYGGQSFSYNDSPNYFGSTLPLKGFDTYTFSLYVDFALTGITLVDASSPAPVPVPPALWLFGSGLIGLVGMTRKKQLA